MEKFHVESESNQFCGGLHTITKSVGALEGTSSIVSFLLLKFINFSDQAMVWDVARNLKT